MTLEVMKSIQQNQVARAEMTLQGMSCTSSLFKGILRRWGVISGINVGHAKKSWDVLRTVRFVEQTVPKEAPILDIGSFASEILCALYHRGYTDLTGIDLNQRINEMPYNDVIKYQVCNLYDTPFSDASFSIITAISVIEHGFDRDRLLAEVSRLLKPGGYFLASVDYWPTKIDTQGITAFGVDWIIFSRQDIELLLDQAKAYGLMPCGDLDFQSEQPTMEWLGKSFTFAWMALKKKEIP